MDNSIEFSLREKKIRFGSEQKSVLLTAKAKRAREFNIEPFMPNHPYFALTVLATNFSGMESGL